MSKYKVGQILTFKGPATGFEELYVVTGVSHIRDVTDVLVIDTNYPDAEYIGREFTMSPPEMLFMELAFDAGEVSPSLAALAPPQEQVRCSCDFVTVILPYGCKCGGK